jgi:hypothetical protein
MDGESNAIDALLDRVHVAVTAYVRARRDAGVPVERVLARVKGFVRAAAVRERWPGPTGPLTAQVVRWSLEALHLPAERPAVARASTAELGERRPGGDP